MGGGGGGPAYTARKPTYNERGSATYAVAGSRHTLETLLEEGQAEVRSGFRQVAHQGLGGLHRNQEGRWAEDRIRLLDGDAGDAGDVGGHQAAEDRVAEGSRQFGEDNRNPVAEDNWIKHITSRSEPFLQVIDVPARRCPIRRCVSGVVARSRRGHVTSKPTRSSQ